MSDIVVENTEVTPITPINPEKKEEVKPKPRRKTVQKDVKPKINKKEIQKNTSELIEGIFNVLSFPLGEQWKIEKVEADKISIPLINLFERYNILEKLGNTSDVLALLSALGIIVVPRVLATKIQMDIEKTTSLKDIPTQKVQPKTNREQKKESKILGKHIESIDPSVAGILK